MNTESSKSPSSVRLRFLHQDRSNFELVSPTLLHRRLCVCTRRSVSVTYDSSLGTWPYILGSLRRSRIENRLHRVRPVDRHWSHTRLVCALPVNSKRIVSWVRVAGESWSVRWWCASIWTLLRCSLRRHCSLLPCFLLRLTNAEFSPFHWLNSYTRVWQDTRPPLIIVHCFFL